MTKQEALKKYFGHTAFRPGQETIIDRLLQGRDVLAVMPTGAGKSACYQIPALLLPGITLVISPLISLMTDQVNALIQAGVRAAYINSSLTAGQYRRVLSLAAAGTYKIIYVAPERLDTEGFAEVFSGTPISLLAVDEAHCVSQWGQDFRPSYLKIAEFAAKLPVRPVIGAFTATATGAVKQDICHLLNLRDPFSITTGFDRPNLYFGVQTPRDKEAELLRLLGEYKEQSGIIYCSTRKAVEEVCTLLNEHGFAATRYHAGLPDEERRRNQDEFVYDRKSIMVATNAFGMGIDKSNVSFVIHYNMPKNLESYYQEAGRAGRDGSPADCILLYSPGDVRTAQFLLEHAEPNPDLSEEEQESLRAKDRERLKYMTFYCTTSECLRAFILRYFGEDAPPFCGNCSGCDIDTATVDATIDAQKVLCCVAKTGQRYGINMIIDVLRGSKNERLLRLGLNHQSTYGILADCPQTELRRLIQAMMMQNALLLTDSEYPVLMLSEKAAGILRGKAAVFVKKAISKKKPETKKSCIQTDDVDTDLFNELKKLRARLAKEVHAPAYTVFSDAALADMCRKLPRTPAEFLEVSGVGQAKLDRYGDAFLHIIAPYAQAELP